MLTRALFLAAGWFVISLAATLAWDIRLRRGNILYSLGWLATVLLLGDLWAVLTFGVPREIHLSPVGPSIPLCPSGPMAGV